MKKAAYMLLGIGAVLIGGLLYRFGRARPANGDPARSETVNHSVPPPSHAVTAGACRAPGDASGVSEPGMPAADISLGRIPPSRLKSDLLKLKPEDREAALETLSSMNFSTNDVDSLRVDAYGGIYFVCSFTDAAEHAASEEIAAPAESEAAAPVAATVGAGVPISSPPIRHSRPGAGNVLFLDFNGHVISGTIWNVNTNYGPTAEWDCRPYDIDGDETTFSAAEQTNIVQVWARVAEDYAPFDVDVTTEQPAVWSSTTGHALITPTTDKQGRHCPHYGYGGIAYVGVFGSSRYSYDYWGDARSPAWVKQMSPPANMAEAVSHELGHNIGLSHDGSSAGSYYHGHANGSISWAPIMGTGYGKAVSQWCKGEYYSANQTQNDLAIISADLGYRPDDHGDNQGSASPLTVVGSGEIADGGVIEKTGDPDVFSFSTIAGEVTINATAFRSSSGTRGANLDILLELYDSSGTLIASDNPELSVDASITITLAAGQYFLHVKPTGVGTPLNNPPTGYTVYGSLGQYTLSGSLSADVDGDSIPNSWEFDYFGSITGADPGADFDGDGADNLTEYVTGYDPTNGTSVFRISSALLPAAAGDPVILTWPTKPGRLYSVSAGSDLLYGGFSPFPDAIDLPYTRNSYTDQVQHAESLFFYRIDVKLQN